MEEKTMTTQEIFAELKKPFKPEDIEWRIGRKSKDRTRGTVLAYMTARGVQERLDEVVGPDKWSVEYNPVDFGVIQDGEKQVPIKGFLATITLEMPDGRIIIRSDGSNLTDFELFKGGISGALKRAASAFGIGRYLYNLPEVWVSLDNYGNFTPPHLPEWALPEGYQYPENQPVGRTAPLPEQTHSYTAPAPESAPASTSGEVVFSAGKYRGMPVSSVTDFGYLRWVVNKSNMSADIKKAAAKLISSGSVKPPITAENEPA